MRLTISVSINIQLTDFSVGITKYFLISQKRKSSIFQMEWNNILAFWYLFVTFRIALLTGVSKGGTKKLQ